MKSTSGTGWPADIGLFGLWSLTGLAGGAVLAGAFTIGIFFVPVVWLFLGLSLWRTVRRPGRAHTIAGLLVGPAAAIGYLGSWLTFMSDSGGSDLVWLHAMPFIVVGTALLVVAVTILIIGHHRHETAARTW